ncbi:hypothetical protein, partial [Mycobacterium canetti]|uniref:hypothetical protein n=1 Tax=Mycobacterium canetti TaxID=78331 RepID=UPI002248EFE3
PIAKALQEAGQFSVAALWSVFSCRRHTYKRYKPDYRQDHIGDTAGAAHRAGRFLHWLRASTDHSQLHERANSMAG